jgi:oligopeptide/dipeptide ABC transporter ATP-binding protein
VAGADLLLDVRDLRVEYGNGSRAVRGVRFQIRAGEVVGLLGESGCGKTSVALAVAGLLPRGARRSGTVSLVGDGRRRAAVGFLFQEAARVFHPFLSLGRQMREAARVAAAKDQVGRTVEEALEAVGLPAREFAGAFPHQLSGGQLQRAQLAQVLVGEPAVIVADEPTAALDRAAEDQVLDLIDGTRGKAGVLLISHEPEMLRRRAGRVMVMYGGKVVERGTAEEVLDAPRHPYTQALMACGKGGKTGGRIAEIPGHPPDPRGGERGCSFAPRCAYRMAVCEEREPAAVDEANEVSCWAHGG